MNRWLGVTFGVTGCFVLGLVGGRTETARPAASRCEPQWRVVAHKGVPSLTSVVAVGRNDVWAVGSTGEAFGASAVAVRWNGRTLQRFQPFGRTRDRRGGRYFEAVAAAGRHVWAVGTEYRPLPGRPTRPLIAHWDGRRWRTIAVPTGGREGILRGVAARSVTDVWAVGGVSGGEDTLYPLVLHWDGKAWRRVDVAEAAREEGYLFAVRVIAATDVWMVGRADSGTRPELLLRGNGRDWQRLSSPLASINQIPIAIGARGADDVWTLHLFLAGAGDGDALVQWSGGNARVRVRWRYDPRLPENVADFVPVSAANAWLAAYWWNDGVTRAAMLQWNGKTTRVVRRPFASTRNASLKSISMRSPTDIWAAGDRLIARYSC